MVCVATVRSSVSHVAEPALSVWVLVPPLSQTSGFAPSKNCTEPVGVPGTNGVGLTVAVNVTLSPGADPEGFEETSVVLVGFCATTCETLLDVLVAHVASAL